MEGRAPTQMILARKPDLKTTLLPDGHAVVFSPITNWAYTLNPMAAAIWEFCDGKSSRDALVDQLLMLLKEVDPEKTTQQIGSMIDELIEAGLLTQE